MKHAEAPRRPGRRRYVALAVAALAGALAGLGADAAYPPRPDTMIRATAVALHAIEIGLTGVPLTPAEGAADAGRLRAVLRLSLDALASVPPAERRALEPDLDRLALALDALIEAEKRVEAARLRESRSAADAANRYAAFFDAVPDFVGSGDLLAQSRELSNLLTAGPGAKGKVARDRERFTTLAGQLDTAIPRLPVRPALALRRLIDLGGLADGPFSARLAVTQAERAVNDRQRRVEALVQRIAVTARETAASWDHRTGLVRPRWAFPLAGGLLALGAAGVWRRLDRPARVLLVEDEPLNRAVGAALLDRRGCIVTAVGTGREAVARAAERRFDVVFLDLHLPDIGGIEVIRAIRKGGASAHCVLAVVTASSLTEDAEKALTAGADAVIAKPLRWDALPSGVRAALGDPQPEEPLLPVPVSVDPQAVREAAIAEMRELLPDAKVEALLTGAAEGVSDLTATLATAQAAGDRETVAATAHRLAGLAGVYGCSGLHAAAQALERAADGVGEDETAYRAVISALPAALAHLERHRRGTGETV